jgi:hypothetical protein
LGKESCCIATLDARSFTAGIEAAASLPWILAPRALSPPHVHGGDVTAVAAYSAGEMFHEPYGTTHVFFENPSETESADVLAITIHDEGATLTTLLD